MKNQFIKISAVALLLITTIIAQTGCSSKTEPKTVTAQSYYLDTICKITIYDMDDMSVDRAQTTTSEAFAFISNLEDVLSKTKEGSDIYRINHSGGAAVEVSEDTINVLEKAIYYGDKTDGLFDVTIGKAEDLWDFHSDNPVLPDEEKLDQAVSHVNYKNIIIEGNTVKLLDPDAEIDLGAIGKGYIGDRTKDFLKSKGVKRAIISLGGNITTIGGTKDDPFTIGIERPYSEQQDIIGTVEVADNTVVTSGIYERFIEVDGVKYHHILDVKTGYPRDTDVVGVTIIGADDKGSDCDAISTTCLILGVDKGLEFVNSIDGIEASFMDKDGKITTTKGFHLDKE